MLPIIESILPVILIGLLGYFLKSKKFFTNSFWDGVEQLAYFVLLPSLFFRLTLTLDLSSKNILLAPFILCLTIAIITVLMVLLRSKISRSNPCFTSMYQGAIRFNSYITLSIALVLYGTTATGIVAILVGITVPIINFCCIYMLTHYGKAAFNIKNVIIRMSTNPLLLSCVIGISFNLLNIIIPDIIDNSFKILSMSALAIGLLCVGAAIDFKLLRSVKSEIIISSFFKLIFFPLTVLALGVAFNLEKSILAILVLFTAVPTAPTAYILAKQFNGNARLMAIIIMAQTLAAIVSMPLILTISESVLTKI